MGEQRRARRRAGGAVAATVAAGLVLAGCGAGSPQRAERSGVPEDADLAFSIAGWKTDFSKHSVPLGEFASGGPSRDGIPPIDDPKHVSQAEADRFLDEREPVAAVELDGRARAYPIQILVWHEIANDALAGRPIAVTYCPLCNSTVVFDRRVDGRTLSFGTTGNLRKSDLVMWDRQTESWWQQLTAEAVVGELTGRKLGVLPSQILSWRAFRRLYPRGDVLSRDTGHDRAYGRNPYVGYDRAGSEPFALGERADRSLPPKERVATIRRGRRAIVYPFSKLRRRAPINDRLDGRAIVVFFDPAVRSALDAGQIAESRNVGASAIFDRRLAGRTLGFRRAAAATFRDMQTGSLWNMRGQATAGPLAGRRLRRIPHDDQLWFAVAAFFPKPDIR